MQYYKTFTSLVPCCLTVFVMASCLAGSDGSKPIDGQDADQNVLPRTPQCTQHTQIQTGMNYGTNPTDQGYHYSVYGLRRHLEAPFGSYSVRVLNAHNGIAYLYNGEDLVGDFAYDVNASLAEHARHTLRFEGYFELDLGSDRVDDLTLLDKSLFDGCHILTIEQAPQVVEGNLYGAFLIEALVIDSAAPAGTYTFYVESGNSGTVQLRLDEGAVTDLAYPWTTIVGPDQSFTFDFTGFLSLTVARQAGTSTLFGLGESLFDGRHQLIVSP